MARALRTTSFTEPKNISDVVKSEIGSSDFCREAVTVLSGSGVLKPGHVLGRISRGGATSAAKSGGNTGNGALTLDGSTPVLANAKLGVYTVRCIAAATNGGTFRVEDPDGLVLGDVAVAGTFSDGIKFSIADGASDFIVGDGFDITVAAGSGKWKKYNPTATDGSAQELAILLGNIDATSADVAGAVVLARMAVVSRLGLEWDASVDSESKKDAAIALLAKNYIITRAGA